MSAANAGCITRTAEASSALREIYARLDRELEPFRRFCDSRGNCCHFNASGHMLYVTGLEAAEMARSGKPADRSLALAGTCPYLSGTMCGIREHRALGCRIYYCDRTYEEQRNALYERFLKEIREIESKFELEHSYGPVTQVDFQVLAAGNSHEINRQRCAAPDEQCEARERGVSIVDTLSERNEAMRSSPQADLPIYFVRIASNEK